ncbi:LEM3 (ligand-effect modulator 3) family / CDC50 family, putative [Leishmania lindenbergi]|uniref:LEM3 (Ligand-effect modulator 3) family / CDC50 family n=1 Tax=Leishmania lindenbergi TaxID=651832 RepID=A0AAW2ZYB4_9TRYP
MPDAATAAVPQRESIWTLFKQQRLPAWQPILTPLHSILCLFAVATVCLPLSLSVFQANASAADITVRYDNQQQCSFGYNNTGAFRYETSPESVWQTGCITDVSFRVDKHLKAPVYVYYGLDNFYQNHRRFSKSKSDAQLAGQHVSAAAIASATSPLTYPGELCHAGDRGISLVGTFYHYSDFVYVPAGLIPWSMFNDTFTLYHVPHHEASTATAPALRLICNGSAFSRFTNEPLEDAGRCHKKGIAWTSDAEVKYKKPYFPPPSSPQPVWSAPQWAYEAEDGDVNPSPPSRMPSDNAYFNEGWYAGEPGHRIPVTTDEDLMVWARVASLPKFRKLYRVIDEDLVPGTYLMRIHEHFDAASFGGEKSFSLATMSWLGGRNSFMAWMYLVIGVVSTVSGVSFLCFHHWYGDRALCALATLLKGD